MKEVPGDATKQIYTGADRSDLKPVGEWDIYFTNLMRKLWISEATFYRWKKKYSGSILNLTGEYDFAIIP